MDVKKIVTKAVMGNKSRSERDFRERYGATDEGVSFHTAEGKEIPVRGGKLRRDEVK